MKKVYTFLRISILSLLVAFTSFHFAEGEPETDHQNPIASTSSTATEEPSKPIVLSDAEKSKNDLIQITERIFELRKQLTELTRNKKKFSPKELEERKTNLQKELSSLNKSFETLATKVSEDDLPQKVVTNLDWVEAFNEITKPLLIAIHDLSDRPRKIDLLNAKISALKSQLQRHKDAISNIEKLSQVEVGKKNPKGEKIDRQVLRSFEQNLSLLKEKYNPDLIQVKLDEAEQNLFELKQSKESFFVLFAQLFANFFKERGRNIFITLLVFFGFWGGLTFVFRWIFKKTPLFGAIPRSYRKFIKTISNIFFFSIAFLAGIFSLFVLNDWLLLTLFILVLVAITWASRQLIPKLFAEFRLMLNLGTIREDERVIWMGVPFLIREIGVYVRLKNPLIAMSGLRVPVGEFEKIHSRPVGEDEPWFPTRKDDWVLLSDGTFGRVVEQTIEQVIVKTYAAEKFYLTSDFLSLQPKNLSNGYQALVSFGLDYEIQGRICDELPKIFLEGLKKYFSGEMGAEDSPIKNIQVEFKSADESALTLLALVDIGEKYGEHYFRMQRRIQAAMVEICNQNSLTIPFNQMTLSQR